MQSKCFEKIFLTGFMGAGKSTVGRLLAKLLECPFVDLDEIIVQREQRPIAAIFSDNGENYFRECETSVLNELASSERVVYATGGGIVMREENRIAMRSLGRIVYLKSDWSTLQSRLQKSAHRPLVDPKKGWEDVRALWVRRQPFYEDADLVIETDGCSPLQVAQRLATELAERVNP